MDRPIIFDDSFYRECIELSKECKTDYRSGSAFGAVLKKGERIIGRGFNRAIVHKNFRLERIIRQGYVNHSEGEALNNALENRENVEEASMYVAGYFPSTRQLFFHPTFTCTRCSNLLKKYGIKDISVPMPEGWRTFQIEQAIADSKMVPKDRKLEYRMSVTAGNFFLEDL